MDSEIIYAIGGIVVFILIIIFTLNKDPLRAVKTKQQKRDELIASYKDMLQKELDLLKNDEQARVIKKSFMLKKINDELAMNIFIDNSEIKGIILELSKE